MAPLLMITDSIILSACHFSRPSYILFIIGDRCLTGDGCLRIACTHGGAGRQWLAGLTAGGSHGSSPGGLGSAPS